MDQNRIEGEVRQDEPIHSSILYKVVRSVGRTVRWIRNGSHRFLVGTGKLVALVLEGREADEPDPTTPQEATEEAALAKKSTSKLTAAKPARTPVQAATAPKPAPAPPAADAVSDEGGLDDTGMPDIPGIKKT